MMWRRCLGRAGASSLEFAIIMPIFVAILIGVTDWGLAIDRRIQLQTAVRAGAQHAMRAPSDAAGIRAAVQAAAPDLQALTVDPPVVFCECNAVATTCTTACNTGMQRFVRVAATLPYTPISPAGPTSVAANVTLRLQ